jgi:hypothetical protein
MSIPFNPSYPQIWSGNFTAIELLIPNISEKITINKYHNQPRNNLFINIRHTPL